jgi:hypothetical protein
MPKPPAALYRAAMRASSVLGSIGGGTTISVIGLQVEGIAHLFNPAARHRLSHRPSHRGASRDPEHGLGWLAGA